MSFKEHIGQFGTKKISPQIKSDYDQYVLYEKPTFALRIVFLTQIHEQITNYIIMIIVCEPCIIYVINILILSVLFSDKDIRKCGMSVNEITLIIVTLC